MARISKSEAKRKARERAQYSGKTEAQELSLIMADNVVFDDSSAGYSSDAGGCADSGSSYGGSSDSGSSYGSDSGSCGSDSGGGY